MRKNGFSGKVRGKIKLFALLATTGIMAGCIATVPPQPLERLPAARWGKIFSGLSLLGFPN